MNIYCNEMSKKEVRRHFRGAAVVKAGMNRVYLGKFDWSTRCEEDGSGS